MFHLSSSSKLLKKLSQLPIGLPAQSVRSLPGKSPFFSPSSSTARYKNPAPSPMVYLQNVYRERSISTILQKNRGLRTGYRHTASCGSLSWPWCLTSTQFPLPLPTPHPGPCVIELSQNYPWWRLVKGAITQLKKYWEKSVDEFSPWNWRKHARNEEKNIWYYHGQYFAGKKVFNTSRGSCSRFTYALFVQRVNAGESIFHPFPPFASLFRKDRKMLSFVKDLVWKGTR